MSKFDSIEQPLMDNLFKSVVTIEESLAFVEKDVLMLNEKTKRIDQSMKELE